MIPPRELYEKILELRAALAETERRSRAAQDEAEERAWRVAREMELRCSSLGSIPGADWVGLDPMNTSSKSEMLPYYA